MSYLFSPIFTDPKLFNSVSFNNFFGNRLMMNCTGISCNECCSCYFLFLVFLFVNYFWILVECVLGQGQWLVTAHVFVLGLANDAHTDCSVCRWIENFRSMLLLSSVCVETMWSNVMVQQYLARPESLLLGALLLRGFKTGVWLK